VVDDHKVFGDEHFIRQMDAEDNPPHENNISDGYILVDEEKMPFVRCPVLNGRLSVIMPEAFEIMTKELAEIKYPSINRPDEIYTNSETTINFSVSLHDDEAANEDIPDVKDTLQKVIMRMHPASRVIHSKTIEVSGINIAYFDFKTAAIDMDIYNMMFFLSINGRIVVGSFNCPWVNMDTWKPVITQMLGSMEVN
jgi:hypothetical protein